MILSQITPRKTNINFCFPYGASGKKKGWGNIRGGERAIRDVEMEIERDTGIIKFSGGVEKTKIKHAYMEMSQ